MDVGHIFLDLLIASSDVATIGSFIAIFLKLQKTGSAVGVSLLTLLALVSARTLHIASHGLGLHYIPTQLPWVLYPFLDACNCCAGVVCFGAFLFQHYHTYEREKDSFGMRFLEKTRILPQEAIVDKQGRRTFAAAAASLYILVTIGAFGWYAVRKSQLTFLLTYFCCFYEVMSAIALVPQLWMFQQDKRVSPPLANFVVLTAVNRMCTLCFWALYPMVNFWRYPDNRTTQMVVEFLNLLILGDFLYYWVRAKMRGESDVIIGDDLDV